MTRASGASGSCLGVGSFPGFLGMTVLPINGVLNVVFGIARAGLMKGDIGLLTVAAVAFARKGLPAINSSRGITDSISTSFPPMETMSSGWNVRLQTVRPSLDL